MDSRPARESLVSALGSRAGYEAGDPQGVNTLQATNVGLISQATGLPRRLKSPLRVAAGKALARTRRARRFLGQCAMGTFTVGLLTLCGIGLHLNLSTASLLYLLLVVLLALEYGFWQASVISVAAVVVQSYCFAPPAYSFYISDPQNAIAIIVFEATALLVSRISTREKEYAREREAQQRSMKQMYAISRRALLLNLQESPVNQMAALIREECGVIAVAILETEDGVTGTAGHWPFTPDGFAEHAYADLYRDPNAPTDQKPNPKPAPNPAAPGLSRRTMRIGDHPIGSLLVLGRLNPLTMDALASLVALTFDRYRAFNNERNAEAARRTEQLRTTVLDGLAHAFKTPLTIIRAASSGLLEMGGLDELQHQLTTLIDTQSMRLDEMATRLLKTARLDGENIELEREVVSMRALLRDVAASVTRSWAEQSVGAMESPRVQLQIEGESLSAVADYEMLTATVRELLINAAKYSIAGSPITVRATESASEVMVSVHNRGPVIKLEDRERIFERFYRCPEHRHSAPGTGIGLSMARHALDAHGGHIWVISGEREGTTFNFSLPRGMDTQRTLGLEARLCPEKF